MEKVVNSLKDYTVRASIRAGLVNYCKSSYSMRVAVTCEWASIFVFPCFMLLSCEYTDAVANHCHVSNSHCVTLAYVLVKSISLNFKITTLLRMANHLMTPVKKVKFLFNYCILGYILQFVKEWLTLYTSKILLW